MPPDGLVGKFIGYLSLVILELNIYSLYQRNMLLCTEWQVFRAPPPRM